MRRASRTYLTILSLLVAPVAHTEVETANQEQIRLRFEQEIAQCKDQLKTRMKENDRIFDFLSLFGDKTPIGCYGVTDPITNESRKNLHDKYIGDTATDAEYRQNLILLSQEITEVASSLGISGQSIAGSDLQRITASEFAQIQGGSTNRAPIDTLKNYSTISGSK